MTRSISLLTFDKSYDLPPETLWQLLTDPAIRCDWSAPSDDMPLEVEQTAEGAKGQDIHVCRPGGEEMFRVLTRWYQRDAPRHATCTETLVMPGEPEVTSLISYRLESDGRGSTLQIDVAVCAFGDAESLEAIAEGWGGALERLDRLVAARAKSV